jgi:hypothetical protein
MLHALLVLAAADAQAGDVPGFESLDRNDDGVVSAEEASERHGLKELIPEYDDNGDGRLDRGEYQALVEDAEREAERVLSASD